MPGCDWACSAPLSLHFNRCCCCCPKLFFCLKKMINSTLFVAGGNNELELSRNSWIFKSNSGTPDNPKNFVFLDYLFLCSPTEIDIGFNTLLRRTKILIWTFLNFFVTVIAYYSGLSTVIFGDGKNFTEWRDTFTGVFDLQSLDLVFIAVGQHQKSPIIRKISCFFFLIRLSGFSRLDIRKWTSDLDSTGQNNYTQLK